MVPLTRARTRLSLRRVVVGGLFLLGLAWSPTITPPMRAQQREDMPVFEVDRGWPKPLPNKWTIGPVSGITADSRDHIWVIQRGEAVAQAAGAPAPPVIEFDAAGNVVQTWGGPGTG